jgi:AsmA protein
VTAATAFKRLGIPIAAVLAGSLAVIGVVAVAIPEERVREAVRAEIGNVTGLDLGLHGPVSVSLFPTGSVSFSRVSLGDDGVDVMTADRLNARLRLLPLLTGNIEVSDVSLERPHITVAFGRDGRSNWSGLVDRLALALGPKGKRANVEAQFSEIRIARGTVVLKDETHGLSETLENVELALAWPSISRSFAATGRMNWKGQPIDTALSLSDFSSALAGERSGIKLRMSGAPFKLGFDGALSTRPTLKVEGTLAADAPSLREVLRWSGHQPLTGGGFGRFALKAKTSIAGGTISLSGVNVELDGNKAEGVLTFASAGRQTLQGTLAAEEVDLTPYVGTVRFLTANERVWSQGPISLEGLNSFDLDLRLSSQRVTLARAKLGRTAIAANLRGGRMTVTVGEAQAFGGIVKGAIQLAAVPDVGAEVKSQLHFADVDLEACLNELFNFRRIEGRGNMTVSLEASGGSMLALAGSLSGTADLVGRQGALLGLNVEQLLRRLERRPLSGGGDFRTGRTPYDRLTVAIKVTHGTASVEDVRLEGAKVRLGLAGTASIPARDFDLKGVAALVPASQGNAPPPFELPFVVHGPWDDPIMLPDTQALLQRSPAASPLLEAVRSRNTRDTVRNAIERLTGGNPTPPPPIKPRP